MVERFACNVQRKSFYNKQWMDGRMAIQLDKHNTLQSSICYSCVCLSIFATNMCAVYLSACSVCPSMHAHLDGNVPRQVNILFGLPKNCSALSLHACDLLVGQVVRRPPRERKIPGSNPACTGIFSGSSHTSDLKIGTPVATLLGAWRYRVSTGTGRPGVSIL